MSRSLKPVDNYVGYKKKFLVLIAFKHLVFGIYLCECVVSIFVQNKTEVKPHLVYKISFHNHRRVNGSV